MEFISAVTCFLIFLTYEMVLEFIYNFACHHFGTDGVRHDANPDHARERIVRGFWEDEMVTQLVEARCQSSDMVSRETPAPTGLLSTADVHRTQRGANGLE